MKNVVYLRETYLFLFLVNTKEKVKNIIYGKEVTKF